MNEGQLASSQHGIISDAPTGGIPNLVLVVDDDPAFRKLAGFVLEDAGYLVDVASDGREALERVELARPDLILLDIQMPVMDGPTFARALHSRYGSRIPIVLMSAETDTRQRATELGLAGFLLKPFEIDQLLSAVAKRVAPAQAATTSSPSRRIRETSVAMPTVRPAPLFA